MSSLLLMMSAWAGSIYINNIPVQTPPVVEMKNVTVRIDAEGNIWIDAPNYQVREVAPPNYVPAAGTNSVVPVGTWWLVTEDNGSTGSVIDVMINGQVIRRVISGQTQLIMDVGPYLKQGTNEITMLIQPGAPGGGLLNIYVGQGSNASGTIRLEAPSVRYARRSADSPEGGLKTYTVTIP